MTSTITPGFVNPVFDSQAIFRQALAALSRPGLVRQLPSIDLQPPSPLTPAQAAIALALIDSETSVWLDDALAAVPTVSEYLTFHTGVRFVQNPIHADFALITNPNGMPPLSAFAQGSDEYPDRSASLILAVQNFDVAPHVRLTGPGVRDFVDFGATPLPHDFVSSLQTNNDGFPKGVDVFLVSASQILAIPRSSKANEIV